MGPGFPPAYGPVAEGAFVKADLVTAESNRRPAITTAGRSACTRLSVVAPAGAFIQSSYTGDATLGLDRCR